MSAMDAAVPLTDEEVDARMSAIGLGAWRSWRLAPSTDEPTDLDRRKKTKRSPPVTDP
jgi:hypothetical protein